VTVHLVVNGEAHILALHAGASLADALRDGLALTGTKVACGEGTCGACTVLVDGSPILSCIMLAAQADGSAVTTIEGIDDGPLQRAFVAEDAFQCGFCTPGQIMSATALLATEARPTREQVRAAMSGNLCRCGAYPGIERAVLRAAEELAG
jgi:aerobic-type carbon monoxide dehydrogenase small subunit (CoxS/CutS family)